MSFKDFLADPERTIEEMGFNGDAVGVLNDHYDKLNALKDYGRVTAAKRKQRSRMLEHSLEAWDEFHVNVSGPRPSALEARVDSSARPALALEARSKERPRKDCHYGADCTRKNCHFDHPSGKKERRRKERPRKDSSGDDEVTRLREENAGLKEGLEEMRAALAEMRAASSGGAGE